jgi:hypothetical protein
MAVKSFITLGPGRLPGHLLHHALPHPLERRRQFREGGLLHRHLSVRRARHAPHSRRHPAWSQRYITFYGRKLQIFVIS